MTTRFEWFLLLAIAPGTLAVTLAETGDPAAVDDKTTFAVWPAKPPGETEPMPAEGIANRKPKDGVPVTRVANVSEPTFTFYPAPADTNTGACIVICPGGGYSILAWDLEGTEVAAWANSIGVNAVVLKYRVPRRKGRPMHEAPLQDAQRTIRLVRSKAAEWKLDPDRIGILGFSAGGHLAAAASTNFATPAYDAIDETDALSPKPDFTVLVYPAYLLVEKNDVNELAPELTVTKETPPAIAIMTQDDQIKVECAVAYVLALTRAKVPAELHVYPTGGHGYGLRKSTHGVSSWPERLAEWMRTRGLIPSR
jgi:acetyl esterase/lipase